jgi:hypothetical protein
MSMNEARPQYMRPEEMETPCMPQRLLNESTWRHRPARWVTTPLISGSPLKLTYPCYWYMVVTITRTHPLLVKPL